MSDVPNLMLFYDGKDSQVIAFLLVEVAVDQEDRARGLSECLSLKPNRGMAFVFEQAQPVKMQMRGTKIPLDMMFVDENSRVVDVRTAAPMSTDLYGPEIPVVFVIEANAGWAEKNGIGVGTLVGFV